MMQEQLKSKFGDCKFASVSDCKGSYENTNEVSFFIFDPPTVLNQPVKIVRDSDDYQLIVSNEHKEEICLVKTDKCLFDKGSKCDCMLFSKDKFYLVEIKSSNTKNRGLYRNTAVEQLGATLQILKNADIRLGDFSVSAIICFKSVKPNLIKSALLTRKVIFEEQYSVRLMEGNKIEF